MNKKKPDYTGLNHRYFLLFYCSTKLMGKVNNTFTAFPRCLPGVHGGDVMTTRMASLSSAGSTLLTTTASTTLPVELTAN